MAAQSDFEDLRRFSTDLARAAGSAAPQVKAVMVKGAVNIKRQMRSEMKASRYFKGVAKSITYDVKAERDAVEIEIGPDKGIQGGALANIAYFGGTGWGGSRSGGTVADPQLILDAESEVIERFIGEIPEGLI